MTEMSFDKGKLEALKTAYARAVKAGVDTFAFDGSLFVVGYAKYLIEYLETRFKDAS